MGNILCRDKSPRRVYVKGPIKGTDAYNPQLFQTDSLVNGTTKNDSARNHNNQIFYSTPNLNSDMKSSISLDARIFDNGKNKIPPSAPPRKKRTTLKKGSTLPTSFSNDDSSRAGFKDIFGKTTVASSNFDEIDYIDKEENSLHERSSSSNEQRTSTPEKKLRVGNKKSDNFFGESLSDHLSDEPISPISKNGDDDEEPNDAKSLTDKKLSFFLMNMLDDIRDANDEEKYKGMQPVDEEKCIMKKRVTKHICDDDDHMHDHFHGHEKDDDIVAPPKPDRDFSKFKATESEKPIEVNAIISTNENIPKIESAEEKIEDVQAKARVKRLISRENLPTPPKTPPNRKSGVTSLPTTPTITIETIDLNNLQRNVNEKKGEEINETKKQMNANPQQITELVDEMIKKAYGVSPDFHPEDLHHGHDDGTTLVTPTSKLAVRKISTPRKISTASTPSIEGETSSVKSVELPVVTTSPFKKTSFCEDPIKLNELLEESHRKFYDIDEAARVPNKSPIPHEKHEEKLQLQSGGTMNDIIDEIYSKNSDVMKEFQSFLEQSIEKEPVINVEEEKKFIEHKRTLGDDGEEEYPQKDIEDDLDNRYYSDSFESSDTEQEQVLTAANNNTNNSHHLPRRESIEDVDNWFSHHIELEEKESDVCNLRSGSDIQRPTGYDTHKIFPFGSTITNRRESLSDEFFNEPIGALRIKPHIETVHKLDSSISEDGENKEKERGSRGSSLSKESSKSPDHSTLLKFFDKTNDAVTNENK